MTLRKQVEIKKEIVSEIVESLKNATSVVFVDYKGINVAQDTQLRKSFRENGTVYKVYKNRLLARALEEIGITDYDKTLLEGTTSVAFGLDEVQAAKTIVEFTKKEKVLDVKFGIVNGVVCSKDEMVALAKLPSKPVLISMLLGMLQAPVSSLARALNEISKKEQA